MTLRNVFVVLGLTKNLLSVSQLTRDYPVQVIFTDSQFHIQTRDTGQVLATGTRNQGLYLLDSPGHALAAVIQNNSLRASFELWHSRLGHVSPTTVSLLSKLGLLSLTALLPLPSLCKTCQLAKNTRLPFVSNNKRANAILDLIHCDLWGPTPVVATSGFRYYAIFIDDHSRFSWFYSLHAKSDFVEVFLTFQKFVENQFSRKIKQFQSDGGTEFTNTRLRQHFSSCSIRHLMSCPYTPAQNGRAERKHRHITEMGLSLLFHSSVPLSYWVDAFSTALYIINRLPTRVLSNKSPFDMVFGRTPAYACFHVFGCRVYPCLCDYTKTKFEPRSVPCIFLGYNTNHKGFRCLDTSTGRMYITRHARFDEHYLPFARSGQSKPRSDLSISKFLDVSDSRLLPIPSSPLGETSHAPLLKSTPPPYVVDPSPIPTGAEVIPPLPPQQHDSQPPPPALMRTHTMRTRAQSGIFKPRYLADIALTESNPLYSALTTVTEPKGIKTALKHPEWIHC